MNKFWKIQFLIPVSQSCNLRKCAEEKYYLPSFRTFWQYTKNMYNIYKERLEKKRKETKKQRVDRKEVIN